MNVLKGIPLKDKAVLEQLFANIIALFDGLTADNENTKRSAMTNEELCALSLDGQRWAMENNLSFMSKAAYSLGKKDLDWNQALGMEEYLYHEGSWRWTNVRNDLSCSVVINFSLCGTIHPQCHACIDDAEHPMVKTARHFHLSRSYGKGTDKTALQTVQWYYLEE